MSQDTINLSRRSRRVSLLSHRLYFWLMLSLAILLLLPAPAVPSLHAAHKARVLFISAYHPNFPTFFDQINGLKSVLDEHGVELDIEYMDSKRLISPENTDNFYRYLAYKLSHLPPYQAIIVADDAALQFALKHQTELFDRIPLVFLGVNNIELALAQNNNPYVTGVVEAVSMEDTLRLMVNLHPNLRHIYALVDATPSGQGDLKTFYAAAGRIEGLTFSEISLVNTTFPEFAAALQAVAPTDAVLLLSAYQDKDGTVMDFEESLDLIAAHLTVPLYHLWYHGMGRNVVGGKLISHLEQGKTAGGLAAQILDGVSIQDLPVITQSPNQYTFDYNELVKFNIQPAQLPPDSIILNQPVTFYSEYKAVLWPVTVVILAMGMFIVLLGTNVFKRQKIEVELRESEQKYSSMFENSHSVMLIIDPDTGNIVDANPAACQYYQYHRAELTGKNVAGINQLPPAEIRQKMELARQSKKQHFYFQHRRASGEIRDVEIFSTSIYVQGKQLLHLIIFDVTEQRQMEAKIQQHNRELNLLNRVIAASAAEPELNSLLATVCRELALAFQLPQSSAALILEHKTEAMIVAEYQSADSPSIMGLIIPVESNESYQYLLRHKTPYIINNAQQDPRLDVIHQEIVKRKAQSMLLMPLFINDEVVGSLALDAFESNYFSEEDVKIAESVTRQVSGAMARAQLVEERRQLEEQYFQAQKMESLGRLTGGVAHDFNNLLTAINGFAELMQMRLTPNTSLYQMTGNIINAGQRAAALVHQLLAFSRKQIIEPKIINLNQAVVNMEKMLRRIIGEDIDLKTVLAAELWLVKVDPTQIEQVMINLVVNARDAMPNGGQLTLETRNVVLNPTSAFQLDVPPGNYIQLTVQDTGIGMPEEIQAHVFEPFYTTKETGKGTGLGLSTVYGIIKQSNGDIQMISRAGVGTIFNIYLPIVPNEELPVSAHNYQHTPEGSETILLVEDDPVVRDLVSRTLLRQGYTVLEAKNGLDAIEIANQHLGFIHLLLTDVIMPGMNGKELSQQLRTARPLMRVLFMSGYTDDIIAPHGVLEPDVAFIQKPLSPTNLARRVRALIDESPVQWRPA
jgi:PAS domain S-box-containing protein